jgi:tetratricopeptide (TPR) repeat protein
MILIPNFYSAPQKVETKVSVYSDLFLTESGLFPLPDNAIELENVYSIPSIHFKFPQKIANDSEGNIYVSDRYMNSILKFNTTGEFLNTLGHKGKGKGEFLTPSFILTEKDFLIIYDMEKKNLEYMDYDGKYLKSKKISEITDIVCSGNNCLYTAPPVQNVNFPLIKAYLPSGRKLTFGNPLSFPHSIQVLNSRSLALNEKGELFVAFNYFPIVRKYSPDGMLKTEFRIENRSMEAKEQYNLKKIGEGIANPLSRVGYRSVIVGIEAYKNKIYLLTSYPRLEIWEIDEDGNVATVYWKEFNEVYEAHDFLIMEVDGEKRFYIIQYAPPIYDIDVFRQTTRQKQRGLKGEIEDLTAEIETNPDYFLAYNNRGIARYRMGDFEGAVKDFSRAIEIDPDSALAYNNCGLAKLKMEDIEGALFDFSKTIELDPKNAVAYFNRGIALIHKRIYKSAIKDFTRAAKLDSNMEIKALEQINYCKKKLEENE